MSREEIFLEVSKKIKNKNLLKHMLAVESIMIELADFFNEDRDSWGLCGLIHDFDYEETLNDFKNHGNITADFFKGKVSEDILYAVRAHTGLVERKSLMDKSIYCADPVSGFIVAATLVLPSKKISDLTVDNLLNRFKEKHFAKGASREQMSACSELGLELKDFFSIALKAMSKISAELGL